MEINLNKFSDIIDKHHKKIVIIWIAVFLISIPIAVHLFSIVSYNVTGNSSNSNASSGNNLQLIVSVSNNSYSNSTKEFFENISDNFAYRNITSLYSIEYNPPPFFLRVGAVLLDILLSYKICYI